MGDGAVNVRAEVHSILASESRETFLLALGHRLGTSTRVVFVEDGEAGSGSLRAARACNEMMIVVWSQLWATRAPETASGYPDAEFLPVLLEKADAGDARPYLRDALESTLLHLRASGVWTRPDEEGTTQRPTPEA
ncbi:hypothetical protein [Streptomyces syringium]|uniref:hypothetical protein n=1 Tax=Streptomyces syringium TaxID=76729 RepID=UPI0033A0B6D1